MDNLEVEIYGSVAYLYDGTLEGLLSAIFLAFERKEEPTDIVPEVSYVPRLDQGTIFVDTNLSLASRVRRGIERAAGNQAFRWVLSASLCDDYDKALVIYRFVRFAMDQKKQGVSKSAILGQLSHPAVSDLSALATKASNEAERLRQFARFNQLENGVWFCRCNPNVSVVPLVLDHFVQRFNIQPFIIYDEVHQVSGIYDGDSWYLAFGPLDTPAQPTAQNQLMEEAWKCFYDALSINARYNPELRRAFMPQRLWKHLPEMQPRCSGLVQA